MRKSIVAMLLGAGLLLTSCADAKAVEQELTGKETEKTADSHSKSNVENSEDRNLKTNETRNSHKQLLMVYMVGSDLESEGGMASEDIAEILESDFDEKNMTVLLCTGGTAYWWTEDISVEEIQVHEIMEGELKPVYTMEGDNMAEAATLTEYLDYGYANYEADHYSLVMWDHGGGAVLGFGADENHDYDTLTLEGMDTAFADTELVKAGERFEWIGFDACLMSMIEVADMLSQYADYLVASEEMEAGEGWDYSCLKTISDGEHFDGQAATEAIAKAYGSYYEENYEYTPDYTLACLDLSKTGEVVTRFEALVDVAADELQTGGYSKIAKLRDQTKAFGKLSSQSFYDSVDLYDLSEKMMALYPDEATALQKSLETFVTHKESNVNRAHGVAVYFPYENKEKSGEWMTAYETTGFSEEYTTFLRSFTGILSGEKLADWDIAEVIPMASEDMPGEYYVQLTQEQYENYAHAKYSIWEEDTPGEYICWISSSDVNVSEDGIMSTQFEGKRYVLQDASGKKLPCCAIEVEREEDYIKYAITVMVLPQLTEEEMEADLLENPEVIEAMFDFQVAYIHFKVSKDNPNGEIIGVYKDIDSDSTMMPNRDTVEIKEGDFIAPFYFARGIKFREDGGVYPFEEWTPASGTGSNFEVTGEITVALEEAEAGTEYLCLFDVMDTQGNSYYTNPVYIRY